MTTQEATRGVVQTVFFVEATIVAMIVMGALRGIGNMKNKTRVAWKPEIEDGYLEDYETYKEKLVTLKEMQAIYGNHTHRGFVEHAKLHRKGIFTQTWKMSRKKMFSSRELALEARAKYPGCDVKKEFCLACVEDAISKAFERGRSKMWV